MYHLKKTKKIENNGSYKFIQKIVNALLLIISCLFFYPFGSSYYLGEEQERNLDLHLPQIDSSMQLVLMNKQLIYYQSISKASIRHVSKTIYRDLIGYDRMDDDFINDSLNLKIEIEYVYPNIFRHSKRTNTLSTWKSNDHIPDAKAITSEELDSILISWGLQERTYTAIWN